MRFLVLLEGFEQYNCCYSCEQSNVNSTILADPLDSTSLEDPMNKRDTNSKLTTLRHPLNSTILADHNV